jgi:hypothetical protein
MKKVLTISERGELAQQLQHKDHFYTDIKLYNEFFPGSKLSSQLAKANEHNMPSLHSRMLYDLLSQVDQEDILSNRKPVELQIVEKGNLDKEAELRSNVISQIKVLLKNNISVERIKEIIGNQPVTDGDPTLDESAFNDLVDTTVEVWLSEHPDYVLTIDVIEVVAEEIALEVVAEEVAPEVVAEEVTPVEVVAEEVAPEVVTEEVAPEVITPVEVVTEEVVTEEVAPEVVAEEVTAPEVVAEEVAPAVEDEKKSVKKATNSQK